MSALTILGSTGSIGRNTLRVIARFPERFRVKALTAKDNVELLAKQVKAFEPDIAVVYDEIGAADLHRRLPNRKKTEILYGQEGYRTAATLDEVDMVVAAMVGAAGLQPTLAAIAAGKDIALANKETLVMAGHIVGNAVARQQVRLLPIDSEHSAIFQSLQGQRKEALSKIILTASGGPFRRTPAAAFETITKDQALKHPNWSMGAKITIDSATLMNKGLEVIEAKWLFDVKPEHIEVLVHPQSIVHSMVAFHDGSIIAQLGTPDMQSAIAYALSYPQRLPLHQALPDFAALQSLTFEAPDFERFPCLKLAFDACREGGSLPAVMNAANEIAVEAFLSDKLRFCDIPAVIDHVMSRHHLISAPDLQAVLDSDHWARRSATQKIDAL